MGKADSTGRAGGAISSESQHIASCIADRLGLAAAPTFAMMALLSGALDVGPPDVLCSATQHAPQLNGMVVMYMLMSAFHSAPWVMLITSRRTATAAPGPAGVRGAFGCDASPGSPPKCTPGSTAGLRLSAKELLTE